MIGTIAALANNLAIINQNQYTWDSSLEHFQWEPRHYV